MEYRFQLGSFPYLSTAEIINVLESENLEYTIIDFSEEELHIEIENINPQILLEILGGTKAIEDVASGIIYKQNIKDYRNREFNKPRVDAKAGLLPSKLAKMMINLSFTRQGVKTVYDPFCGGGTIITEANVMGIKGIGSDIEWNQVKDAKSNAKWVAEQYKIPVGMAEFFLSDVRNIDTEKLRKRQIDAIVTEPYLGHAVNKVLKLGKNDKYNMDRVNKLITEALKKSSAILEKGKRVVIIIPCFRTIKGIEKLEISEKFNRFSFKKVNLLENLELDKSQNLLYFRPKAVVLREIFILEKI